MSDTPIRKHIVRFSPEDRSNVSNEDWKRLLDAGFIPVFVKTLPTIVLNLTADRDVLRTVATGWCALCKGSGYITEHSTSSANSGSVMTRKCVCGGNPFLKNPTAEFWLEER